MKKTLLTFLAIILCFAVLSFAGLSVYNNMMAQKEQDEEVVAIGKTATATLIPDGSAGYDVDVVDSTVAINQGKFASVHIPASAIASDAEKVEVKFIETNIPEGIKVEAGCTSVTYDIAVTGLEKNNDVPVKVSIFIGEEYNSDSVVAVYHYSEAVDSFSVSNGYVTFSTASFSPFTVVYSTTPVASNPNVSDTTVPVANVTYSSDDVWERKDYGSYGSWTPNPELEAILKGAFKFVAPHTAETVNNSIYKDWYCDFYVKLDRDLGANQLFLAGEYGEYGWIGFHNGDTTLEANKEIALLGSVTSNPWTYADVVKNVGTFTCGAGDVEDALDGATFTVSLRLTNPADNTDCIDVNVVTFVFGSSHQNSEYTITNYTPAN